MDAREHESTALARPGANGEDLPQSRERFVVAKAPSFPCAREEIASVNESQDFNSGDLPTPAAASTQAGHRHR
jgi:hypothetical protein